MFHVYESLLWKLADYSHSLKPRLCLYFDHFPYELRILLETWGPLTWAAPGVSEARLTDAYLSRDPVSPGWISLSLPWADSPDALLGSTSFQHLQEPVSFQLQPEGGEVAILDPWSF